MARLKTGFKYVRFVRSLQLSGCSLSTMTCAFSVSVQLPRRFIPKLVGDDYKVEQGLWVVTSVDRDGGFIVYGDTGPTTSHSGARSGNNVNVTASYIGPWGGSASILWLKLEQRHLRTVGLKLTSCLPVWDLTIKQSCPFFQWGLNWEYPPQRWLGTGREPTGLEPHQCTKTSRYSTALPPHLGLFHILINAPK